MTVAAGSRAVPPTAASVLADAGATTALRRLVSAARHDHPVAVALTRSSVVDGAAARSLFNVEDVWEASWRSGLLVRVGTDGYGVAGEPGPDDDVGLAIGVLFPADQAVIVPLPRHVDEVAYVGSDTAWLWSLAWKHGPVSGDVAIDLGCGAGFLTTVLRSRFRHVVGTDLTETSTKSTALTLAVSPVRGRSASVVRTDIGASLASGIADLVVANPPYLPGTDRVWATGGADGMTLPRRFVTDAARLLAPGGVAIVVALDSQWSDGRRPLHELAEHARATGGTVEIITGDRDEDGLGDAAYERLVARIDGLVDARPGAVVLRRGRT